MIHTVQGDMPLDQLGVTSPHEHILIDMRSCVEITHNEPAGFYAPFTAENRAEVWTDPYAVLDNALIVDKTTWHTTAWNDTLSERPLVI